MTDTSAPLRERILAVVYSLVRSRGRWPTFRVVDLRLDRELGVADTQAALLAVPPRYLRRPWQSSGFNDSDEVRLTLRGVAECDNGPADLDLLVKFLRWAAELERARPVEDEGDLKVTSADFATSMDWRLEPEAPSAEDADENAIPPVSDGAAPAPPEAPSEGKVPPEIAEARSALARLRVMADLVRSFWSSANHQPEQAWRWSYTLDPRRVRVYRDLNSVAELLDREEPLEQAEPSDNAVTDKAASPSEFEPHSAPGGETVANGDAASGLDSRTPGAGIDPLLSLLREEIATVCDRPLRAGLFDEAIFAAYRYVESVLQRRAGVTDIGNALIDRAFRSETSPISLSPRAADTERVAQIFSGALGLFKGDRSHKDKPALPCRSIRECLHQLAHASSLLDLLDRDINFAPCLRAYDHDQHTLVLRVERVSPQTRVLISERPCPVISRSAGTISIDVTDVPAGEHELVLIDGTRQSPGDTIWLSREPGRQTWYRVEEINLPLYHDQACTDLLESVSGVRLAILESGEAREQILPTARTYRVGDYVSWQWDNSRSLGPTWLKTDDSQAPIQVFGGSAIFAGEPDAPSHQPRTMKVTLQPSRLRLRVGDKAPLLPTGHVTDGTATWMEPLPNTGITVEDVDVAFYKNGVVYAKGPGTTALRLEMNGLFAEAIVEVAAHPRGTATDWITGLPPVTGVAWTNNGLVISARESVIRRVGTDGKCTVIAGLPLLRPGMQRSGRIAANASGDLAVKMPGHRDILVLHAADKYASSRWIEAHSTGETVTAIAWDAKDLVMGSSDGSIFYTSPNGQTTKVATVTGLPVSIANADNALLVLTGGDQIRQLWRVPKNAPDDAEDILNGKGSADLSSVSYFDGRTYLATFNEGSVFRLEQEGLQRIVGGLENPTSLAMSPDGTMYVAEFGRGAIRRILS